MSPQKHIQLLIIIQQTYQFSLLNYLHLGIQNLNSLFSHLGKLSPSMPCNVNCKNRLIYATFLCFLICVLNSLDIKDTKIETSRDDNRAKICNYYSSSYTKAQRQQSLSHINQYSYMSDEQIQKVIFQGGLSSLSGLTTVIALPHLVSAAVLILLIPFLCCCCVWPQKYPICRTWRKSELQMYTRCQLKWPAYVSLTLYIIICTGSLMALVGAPKIIYKYNDLGCKKAAIFDDLLYGRISSDVNGTFFVGLSPFKDQLNTFNTSKLSTFFSDSSSSLSSANDIRSKQNIVQTNIQSTYTSFTNSIYTNAFSADGTTYYDVSSAFKTMYLGPSSNSSQILGNIKQKLSVIFNQLNNALDNMISAWNSLSTTNQAGVRNQIASTNLSITNLKLQLQIYLDEIGQYFYNNQLYNQLYSILNAFYGIVFGFAILGLIGNFLIAFFTVVRTRIIMYFTCGFLVFFGIIGFVFLIYLAFMHPQMNQICSYATRKLTSGNQTARVFRKMGYPSFADKISQCMQDGSGNVLSTLNTSFFTSFTNINIISKGTLNFNDKISSFTTEKIDQPFTQASQIIFKVKAGQIWDINDLTARIHVSKIIGKSYAIGSDCKQVSVSGDFWIPSYGLYACPPGKSKMPPCSDLGVETTCPLGCYEILNQFTSPSGDHSFMTSLATRYGLSIFGAYTCNYYLYVTNLHNNWDLNRQAKMDSLISSLNSLKVLVDDYAVKTNSIKASLNSFKTTLETNINSMTNSTSGSFQGIDCKIIGESIWDYRDAYCIGLLQSVSYNILCLCLICYGVLLLGCFVTCTGTRHFKHLQKMQMHVGYKGTPISLSDTRLIDK